MVNLHDEIRSNKRKTIFIFISFFLFIGIIGATIGIILGGYYTGNLFNPSSIIFSIIMSTLIAFLYILFFMKSGSKMILKATGATEASRSQFPYLYHTTEALSLAAGMKKPPKCYIIKDTALNAYATGFKEEDSYIVVTTGLIDKLNRQELEGVLAHEMSHIKNKDIKVMLLAAGLVGATVLLADILFRVFIYSPRGGNNDRDGKIVFFVFIFWLALIILAPLVGKLIQMAISRRREFLADSSGALLTRYPEGLASALEKIKNDPDPLVDNANKATAHLFISTPFRKKKSFLTNLFSTHPPIDERIAKLRGKKI